MGRGIHKLTVRAVEAARSPGRISDGGNLYLNISKSNSKSWVFIYRNRATSKLTELGLGSVNDVTLAQAREQAAEHRKQLASGGDPKQLRRRCMQPASRLAFSEVAENYIRSQEAGWRNEKHRAQWRSTIAAYCAPILDLPGRCRHKRRRAGHFEDRYGPKRLRRPPGLEGGSKKSLIQPLRRDSGMAKTRRGGGVTLELLLPRRQKLQRGHHPAMPFQSVPAFVQRLRKLDSVSARALEFIILTAIRSGCVLKSERRGDSHGMRWEEVDFRIPKRGRCQRSA